MEDFKSVISKDEYLQPRKSPTESELRLYLREVEYHCPLCGKELQTRKQRKLSEKKFEIAHIYPNSPTENQYTTLLGLERLGENSETFENKIALCKECHGTQDYHTTIEDYLCLLNKKKACLLETALHDATITLGLEMEIEEVIRFICEFKESDIAKLNYQAIPITNKFLPNEVAMKSKVLGYVLTYFVYIRDLFNRMDKTNGFNFDVLSGQIHACFLKMNSTNASKYEIFEQMVEWINNKTKRTSRNACEAIVSFFIQHCEVFNEITE